MLLNTKRTRGCSIQAIDGSIGLVDDCLFDDRQWTIRHLAVNLGGWLIGQRVLLPPTVVRTLDTKARALEIGLTRQQVLDSPDITTDQPVSHQMAARCASASSGLTPWGMSGLWGLGIGPCDPDVVARLLDSTTGQDGRTAQGVSTGAIRGDPHLRSTHIVSGYIAQTYDGVIGRVANFIIDDTVWAIRYIVIATRTWWPGKKVLVPAGWISTIDWSHWLVMINAPREVVRSGPVFDPSALADPAYEAWLRAAYARMPGSEPMVGTRG